MIEINTKFGVLYMEEIDQREEADRIKLYDSEFRYFDYLPLENIEQDAIGAYCKSVISQLEKIQTIDEILAFLWIQAYTASESWIDLLEDIYGVDGYEYDLDNDRYVTLSNGEVLTEEVIAKNDCVNKIGNMYILVCE